MRWNEQLWRRTQDVTVWSIGAAALVNELFLQSRPRPEAFPIIAVVLGLPFARKQDRQRSESSDKPSPP